MTTPHKATPDQWQTIENYANLGIVLNSCILELRDRIAALEAAANSSAGLAGSNHPAKPDGSPAPAGGLVEHLSAAICSGADCGDTPSNWAPEARAAIKAVAEWFDAIGYGATASILRQEVQRHAPSEDK
jgi:hypothetical protein